MLGHAAGRGSFVSEEVTAYGNKRVALIGIIVEQESSAAALNALLHEYGGYIIGRMGLPYREQGVNIISVVLDAPQDKIAALSGKIGRLPGVSAKTQYSNVISREGENQ